MALPRWRHAGFTLDVSIERYRASGSMPSPRGDLARELSYHVVTDRYIVWNADGTELDKLPDTGRCDERIGQVTAGP